MGDPDALLDELRASVARYVLLPDEHTLNAVTLWIAATHLQQQFQHAPRLAITGPQKRCGKSRLLDVIDATVHRPILTVNATVAAIFRSISDDPPTLLVDEADTIFTGKGSEQTEQLRGLLNAGHQRGRKAMRATGKDLEVQEFSTFAMAALAGIGDLPDTIMDRAIVVRMRRRAAGEHVDSFRSRDAKSLVSLKDRLAAWAESVADQAREIDPAMPVEDRAADTWEPLVAVADLAGGHWPTLGRAACRAMTTREAARPQEDYAAQLLVDIHTAFATIGDPEVLPTYRLIGLLCSDEESPWPTYEKRGLTPRYLQMLLQDFEISSKNYRFAEGGQRKGFARTQFLDAWTRYCPHVLKKPTPQPTPVPGLQEAGVDVPQQNVPLQEPLPRSTAPAVAAAQPRVASSRIAATLHRSPNAVSLPSGTAQPTEAAPPTQVAASSPTTRGH